MPIYSSQRLSVYLPLHFNQLTLLASLGDRGRRYQVTEYSLLLFHPLFMDRSLQFLDGLLYFVGAIFNSAFNQG